MNTFRAISAILLTALLLVSSTRIVVGVHLCGGEVQDFALFSKGETCEEEEKIPPCHRPAVADCCDNEIMVHEANEFKSASFDASLQPVDVELLSSAVVVAEIIPGFSVPQGKYVLYDPPLRSCDLTVQHCVYLI